jgi:hypothetical protein
MKKKTTRPKPKRKLDRIERALVAAASMPTPKARKVVTRLQRQLTEKICPYPPPKPKINPQFRSFCLAYFASHDLRAFAGQIRMAALDGDRVFFDFLAKFLKNKLKRLPMGEQLSALLELYFKKPYLSASEALKELGWPEDTSYYGVMKQRALARAKLLDRIWREGWNTN